MKNEGTGVLARLMPLLVVFGWVVAALLAFQTVEDHNSTAPLDASSVMTVTSWDGDGSAADFRDDLDRFAKAEGVTLAQELPDMSHGPAVRHLYMSDGDPAVDASAWFATGMSDFGESVSTRVHPLEDAGSRAPIGRWMIFGEASTASVVQQYFDAAGARTDVASTRAAPPYIAYVPRPVFVTAWVLTLLLVGTTGAFVVSRTRRYAIERLHGARPTALFAREAAPLLLIWTLAGVSTVALSAGFAALRYDSAGLVPFVIVTTALASVLFGAVLGTLGLVLALVTAVDILGALKGKTASTWLTLTAYALRVTAVLVALGLGASTVALIDDRAERNRAEQPLQRLADASLLSVGNAYTEADQNELGRTIETWLRGLDAKGHLILALQADTQGFSPAFAGKQVLVVNDPFLANQPVTLTGGQRVKHVADGQVTLVVPDDSWAQRDSLTAELARELEPVLDGFAGARPMLVRAAPGQTFSTLSVPSELQGAVGNTQVSAATDPIMVAVSSPLASGYVEGATAGEVLLTDPASALIDIEQDAQLTRFVRSVTPVVDRADAAAADKAAELRTVMFSTVVAYLIVIMAGVAATAIFTRKNARRSFVRHLHGWRVWTAHRSLIVVEVLLLALLVARIPWQVYQERQELAPLEAIAPLPGGLPTLNAHDAITIGLLALVTTGGFWVTLLVAHRRILDHGISEA